MEAEEAEQCLLKQLWLFQSLSSFAAVLGFSGSGQIKSELALRFAFLQLRKVCAMGLCGTCLSCT